MKQSFKDRALENIESAEILFNNEKYNGSANRAYYAAFHASIYAIYSIGLEPKTDHAVIQILISDNFFNRRKILPSKYKRYLNDLQNVRNIADYKTGINKRMAKEQLNNAKEFVYLLLGAIK